MLDFRYSALGYYKSPPEYPPCTCKFFWMKQVVVIFEVIVTLYSLIVTDKYVLVSHNIYR